MSAKLWAPYFVAGTFKSYASIHQEAECFIAFAGSTLTVQHILNAVTEHLGQLRISHRHTAFDIGEYYVAMPCSTDNLLLNSEVPITWDEDMFRPDDLKSIFTSDRIADAIHHSINAALSSARQYKLDKESLDSMRTDVVAGIRCPVSGSFRLFVFRLAHRLNDQGVIEVFAERHAVADREVAVLGMRAEFEADAQKTFIAALGGEVQPAQRMFDFLNACIDKVTEDGRKEIDRPSFWKHLGNQGLKNVGRQKR
ncbi:hypothetical protein [Caballeronia sp. LZ034LL]|uniref:hypothetical protein n=1 Tax=Caballeronia sp. LZ034LL TaxID=3038567 RepID=UPI002857ABCA|nr:hypothetical protein [Caballeronia sp. LZ034LL]MDR5836615.1 hypothetical protein [Caballeronia sp. LZ034LL]